MRRALVVCNSDLPPNRILAPLVRRAHRIVAADGGADRLLRRRILADDVVGDLDSVRLSTLRRIPGRVLSDRDPDRTDLEKALLYVHRAGFGDVTVVGATGGRLDHVLAAVSVVADWSRRLRIRFVDEHFTAELVVGRLRFRAPLGTVVSLFALDRARGVTTRGLRWPLRDATLRRGALGIHNQVVSNPVQVSATDGQLLLLRGHWVEPHQ